MPRCESCQSVCRKCFFREKCRFRNILNDFVGFLYLAQSRRLPEPVAAVGPGPKSHMKVNGFGPRTNERVELEAVGNVTFEKGTNRCHHGNEGEQVAQGHQRGSLPTIR